MSFTTFHQRSSIASLVLWGASLLLVLALVGGLVWPLAPVLANSPSAQEVYGQANLTSGLLNRGVMGPESIGQQPNGVTADASGGVYVADTDNNRVLYFPPNSTTATRVYGQTNFTNRSFNGGGSGASRLGTPQAVAVASDGVYIADSGNHRVLFFPGSSTTATRVYGQPDFESGSANNGGVSATSLNFPAALSVNATGLYVADALNHRVLFFPGSSTTASRVYGQPNFTSSNADNGGVSATSLNGPNGLATDNGGVYVADQFNSRVLYFAGSSTTATRVYGQPNFSSNVANNDGAGNFGSPSATSLAFPRGLWVNGAGQLLIADTGNSRMLIYPPATTTASGVLGQADFSSSGVGGGITGMWGPTAVAVDSTNRVFVADGGNNRVLAFAANSSSADRVYGQADFSSTQPNRGVVSAGGLNGPAFPAVAADGRLYVADVMNSRVLSFPPASTTADRVYGQANFTDTAYNNPTSASSLSQPSGVALATDGVYIADSGRNRVLFFSGSSTTASRVYGQPDFSSGDPNNGGISATSLNNPTGITVDATGLYVVDSGNSRVLFFPGSNTTASRVYGQPDFTSSTSNNGGVSATSLNLPFSPPAGVVAGGGGLYVADVLNNRVLFFSGSSTTASRVYGQPDMTSNTYVGPSSGFNSPKGLALDGNGGLYVADGSHSRVIYFPPSSTTATAVYGQSGLDQSLWGCGGTSTNQFCDPYGVAVATDGTLYIVDTFNHRVVTMRDTTIAGLAANNTGPAAPGGTVTFSASVTAGTNVRYSWSFSDGGSASGATVTRSFSSVGSFTATVTTSNPRSSSSASTTVQVEAPTATATPVPPSPTPTSPAASPTPTGGPVQSGFTRYQPVFQKASFGFNSTLQVQNPGENPASLTLTFVPGTGGGPIVVNASVPARGSISRSAASFASLPDGFSGMLKIDASAFVTSLVQTSGSGSDDVTEVSLGEVSSGASTGLMFVPVIQPASGTAALRLVNPGANAANVSFTFFNSNGSQAATASQAVPAGASAALNLGSVAGLPQGFSGSVVASSDQPIFGFSQFADSSPTLRWLRPAFNTSFASVFATFPRVFYAVDDGGGPRSTTLHVANITSGSSPVDFTFYDSAGNAVVSNLRVIISGRGSIAVNVATVPGLQAGQIYAVKATGLNPIYAHEVTDYDGASSFATDADSYNGSGFPGYLPYVRNEADNYTIISVMHGGSGPINVITTFFNPDGSVAATSTHNGVPQNGWLRIDPRTVPGLPANFAGSAIVDAQAFLHVLVDVVSATVSTPPAPTPTTPAASPTPTTPAASPTPALPTATVVPTPVVGPNDPPQVSINYVAGAPGSSFVIQGFNFPPNRSVQLSVNGTALSQTVQSDSSGQFSLVLATAPGAQEGFYVVTATVTAGGSGASLANVTTANSDFVLYQLVTSGPDAVVRMVPPGGPAASLSVPATVRSFAHPPFVYLPLVRR